jgi:Protein of unknown function (DUF2939)
MRALLKVSLVLLVVAAAYIASPFVAAWNLREAIKAGNVAVVQQKVQWDTESRWPSTRICSPRMR